MAGQYLKTAFGLFCAFIISVSVPPAFAEEDYILGGGDTLNIVVYGQPDLTTAVRVSQDGGCFRPFPGSGRTEDSEATEGWWFYQKASGDAYR